MDNNQVNVHMVVGEILSMQGKKSEAFGFFLKGMELNPETPEVLQKTGSFLIDAGYLEEAEVLLSKALLAGFESVTFDLLDLYEKQGKKKKLKDFIVEHQELFNREKENLTLANAYLSLNEFERTIFYLKGMGVENKTDNWLRAYNNILAQAYEKKGLYSQAFEKYKEQNTRSKTLYSSTESEAHFNKSIGVSSNIQMAEKMSVHGFSKSYKHVFIVGLPRSGTSLLEQILNVDMSVVAAGELNFIESAFNEYVKGNRSLVELSEWYQDKCEF
ncbi:MAG: sulfotransferase, partial [Thiotrichaceae bacterium]|nr:sulfotransferase [Thiotrichaceae bacterium]